MADFNALTALINAYIKQNGVKAITGQILNGVLRGMVSALGKGYTVAGEASPTTDPGTMTGPVAYIAHTAGTYEHFGNLVVAQGEVAMLIYDEAVWRKDVLLSLSANATVDANVGTPEVTCTFVDGVLTFDFRNMKGNPGDAAGFGAITATVDANVGTPGVSVQTSGPDTAKNIAFQFTNLKGETGVTSCVVTVDNTTGTPSCAVSLVGQELHLDFSGLKGAQGNTGSSVDYPFEIVNNLTTNDATKALSAAMGVQLESEVSQLEAKVDVLNDGNITPEYSTTSGYIDLDGVIQQSSVSVYTSPIFVTAGQKVKVVTSGNSRSILSKYDNGVYTALLTASSTINPNTLYTYEYTPDEDMYVVASFKVSIPGYYIVLSQLFEVLKTKVGDYDDVVFRLFRENAKGVENLADFSNYTGADVPYNSLVGGSAYLVSFDGARMTAQQSQNVGGSFAVDLAKLGLIEGERYLIAIKRSKKTSQAIRLVRDVTASSSGVNIADFTNGDFYFYLDYTAAPNRYILFSQLYTETSITYDFTIYKITDIVISHKRKNYARAMSWTPLGDTASTISATKTDDGAVITTPGGTNAVGRFLFPQLKEGHNYSLTIECSTLLGDQTIGNTLNGANKYVFTSQGGGIYTLSIANYQEVEFPLYLRLLLSYSSTTHTIVLHITDDAEQEEYDIVLNRALYGIGEDNLSDELLTRCDFLQNNPTLYRGLDIMAFNKGICIGDSTTAGSLNTTDSQGSSGPNVPADPTKAYPAKLSKLTGIELTNAGDGGKTSYGYYDAHQNDDWSGNEFAIILLGINDVSSIGHGSWDSDSVDAFTSIINKLKAENNGIKIFVSTIINTQSYKDIGGGVNEGIIQLVEDLNDPDVILLDMHKYGRLNLSNAYSCGHPSQYGYYRMAQDFCNYISWYMATHKEEFRFIQFIGTNYVYTKEF